MNHLRQLSLSGKLALGVAGVILLLLTIATTACLMLHRFHEAERSLIERNFANALDLLRLHSNVNAERLDVSSMLGSPREEWESWRQDLLKRSQEDEEIKARLLKRLPAGSLAAPKFKELARLHDVFKQARETLVLQPLEDGRIAEAKAVFSGVQRERHSKMRQMIEELSASESAATQATVARIESKAAAYEWILIAFGLLAVAGTAAIAFLVNRAITAYIAELNQSSAALREEKARYRTLIENLPQKIFFKDSNSVWVSINESFARDLGVLPKDVVGKTDHDFFPKQLADKYRADDARILATGKTEEVDETYQHDGECRVVHTVKTPVYDAAGRASGILGIFWDITEPKRAQEALALQARIANIFLTVLDEELFNEVLKIILDVTRSPFGVFGYIGEAGDLVAPTMTWQVWEKCQVPGRQVVFPRATWGDSSWARALCEQKANYSNEISTKVPAGHVPITRHINMPVLFHGESIGLIQVANRATDYTQADVAALETIAGQLAPVLSARLRRERAQEALRKLNAELEQRVAERTAELQAANGELESFCYAVSHDLRAPLRAIDGFSRILLKQSMTPLDEDTKENLRYIREAIQRMGQLIDDLLSLSRVTRAELRRAPVDLSSLMRTVADALQMTELSRKVEWVISSGLAAKADANLMRIVLENLAGNAWKFTSRKPAAKIEFGRATGDGAPAFYVRDNGAGFDMAYANKLFGAFQRLHRSEEFPGSGIGLATVQRIIHRHGGRVWAEGAVDRGATFSFTLPT